MSTMIMSWCPGQECDPCKPKPGPPSPNGGSGLPLFTDAVVQIKQVQIATDLSGGRTSYSLGLLLIYSAADGIPPQGGFGAPLIFGPPETSSVTGAVVLYESFVQILHPYYPPGSYNGSLPDITTGPLSPTVFAGDGAAASNQAASTVAGNAAIAQATNIAG